MFCDATGSLRSLGQTTSHSALQNMIGNKSRPSSLVRSTQSFSIISVEELSIQLSVPIMSPPITRNTNLVEPYIVSEMWVKVELGIASVGSPASLHITAKDVNDSMLDFFCNPDEIHVIAAASGTLNLSRFG